MGTWPPPVPAFPIREGDGHPPRRGPDPTHPRRRRPSGRTGGGRLLLVGLMLLLSGCRGGAEGDLGGYRVDVLLAPTPPVVGPNRVALTLRDGEGDPVEGASVRLEGTMTHAGMTPVFGDAVGRGEGRYIIEDFGFTMGGDWILRVHVTLADGRGGVLERSTRVVSSAPAVEIPLGEDEDPPSP